MFDTTFYFLGRLYTDTMKAVIEKNVKANQEGKDGLIKPITIPIRMKMTAHHDVVTTRSESFIHAPQNGLR